VELGFKLRPAHSSLPHHCTTLPSLKYNRRGEEARIVARESHAVWRQKKKKNTSRAHKVFDKFQEKNRKK
jgi:hypothetical protein